MTQLQLQHRERGLQQGVTLIELMVAMVIGLIAVLAITQVTALSEGQKRTTTNGSDAQVNGAIALHMLQRDLQSSGYGLTTFAGAMGCTLKLRYGDATDYSWTVAPAIITAGTSAANGNSDSLQILYSTRSSYSTPTRVSAAHTQTGTLFTVDSHIGVLQGDVMMAVPQTWTTANWCSAFQASAAGSANVVQHAAATGLSWNPANLTLLFPAGGYAADSRVVNLGALTSHTYSVASTGLVLTTRSVTSTSTSSDLDGSNASVASSGIVLMKAFYGVDTNGDGKVDSYTQTTPTTAAGWQQVLSVRIAVVARSDQYEKSIVTTAAPEWQVGSAAAVPGSAICTFSSVTTDQCVTLPVSYLTDWQHYRYKIFDTVVPLRNVLWST